MVYLGSKPIEEAVEPNHPFRHTQIGFSSKPTGGVSNATEPPNAAPPSEEPGNPEPAVKAAQEAFERQGMELASRGK